MHGSMYFLRILTAVAEARRRWLKGLRRPARSTKATSRLTVDAFELACSKGITFGEARKEVERTMAANLRESYAQEKSNQKRDFENVINTLNTARSPRANV